ncbi:hematopoietic prostaglandin D synthase-like isoform X2 [Plodia interpunctella]|uniref:hematopoietic prostaglandin D synthase-like isoform X2 n=1 Tax=Plodia interpunctella TaxID=58824 RepID=UPI002368CAB6|nr:hematopoietic prostaglandin D synthase-like isoform X2 [Plodia interpunctella]
MDRKLTYFHLNGYAESIRYMLHYAGLEFQDIRLERASWPIKEIKDALPYGRLPVYEEGDRKLTQSLAIARYIASQTDLLPTDPWEQAVLDAAVLNVYELIPKLAAFITANGPEKKHQAKEEFLTGARDYYLSRFEEELKANNGFFGGKESSSVPTCSSKQRLRRNTQLLILL